MPDRRGFVRAYHGTTLTLANQIIAQNRLLPSTKPFDWLGPGAYFFIDAPLRAWKWAASWVGPKHGDEPAVVAANIDLNDCFDLVDLAYWRYILDGYTDWHSSAMTPEGTVPLQKPPRVRSAQGLIHGIISGESVAGRVGNNFVDCGVIKLAISQFEKDTGKTVKSVRGSFMEGQQLFDHSYFFDHAHLQLAVLDRTVQATNLTLLDSNRLAARYAASAMTRWPI